MDKFLCSIFFIKQKEAAPPEGSFIKKNKKGLASVILAPIRLRKSELVVHILSDYVHKVNTFLNFFLILFSKAKIGFIFALVCAILYI